MLEYNEVLPKKVILLGGAPYEVLESQVSRKQQRKPVNQTKLRNLITHKVTEAAFHVSEKVEEADISLKSVKYLYHNKGQYWFCTADNLADRFFLDSEVVGAQGMFLKPNTVLDVLVFDDPSTTLGAGKIIGLRVPIKMDLRVTEAPPAVRGNTAQGGTKQIVLETGATVSAPMFVNEGDTVRVNTETGTYVERVDKK